MSRNPTSPAEQQFKAERERFQRQLLADVDLRRRRVSITSSPARRADGRRDPPASWRARETIAVQTSLGRASRPQQIAKPEPTRASPRSRASPGPAPRAARRVLGIARAAPLRPGSAAACLPPRRASERRGPIPAASASGREALPWRIGELAGAGRSRRATAASRSRGRERRAKRAARGVAAGEPGGGPTLGGVGRRGRPAPPPWRGRRAGANRMAWQRERTVSSSAAGSASAGSGARTAAAPRASSAARSGSPRPSPRRPRSRTPAVRLRTGGRASGGDHALADLVDQVLGTRRAQPDEVGCGEGSASARRRASSGSVGPRGEKLGGERARGRALAGARRAREAGRRGGRATAAASAAGPGWCSVASASAAATGGRRRHWRARSSTSATRRAWTSSTPLARRSPRCGPDGGGELIVGGGHRALELDALGLEAVGAVARRREPRPRASASAGSIRSSNVRSGRESAIATSFELLDEVYAEAARGTLVGDGGVDEAVADHVAAGRQRRRDQRAGRAGPRRAEEQHLGPRVEVERRVLEEVADALARRRAAGLAKEHGVRPSARRAAPPGSSCPNGRCPRG